MYKIANSIGPLFFYVVIQICAAELGFRSCRYVEPVPDLSMKQLLGVWYVVQSTSNSETCVTYNITKITEQVEDQYLLIKTQQKKSLFSSNYIEQKSSAKLTTPNKAQPGVMDLHIPMSIGTSKLTVFMNDYDNYLAMYICKPYLGIFHTWSVKILSRTPGLDITYIDAIRTRLSSNNVDPVALSFISQKDCDSIGIQGSLVRATKNVVNSIEEQVNKFIDSECGKPVETTTATDDVSSTDDVTIISSEVSTTEKKEH